MIKLQPNKTESIGEWRLVLIEGLQFEFYLRSNEVTKAAGSKFRRPFSLPSCVRNCK